jgi:hypothetical protein
MNPEFLKKALEKIGNPNILVNFVSRRVRQLNLVNVLCQQIQDI